MDNETIDLTSTPDSPEQARASLDTLRSQRVDGKVTEKDYLGRSDYLARFAAGEQDVEAPPDPYPTQDEQYARQLDEIFEPAEPHEYELPSIAVSGQIDPDHQALDTAIRDAMSKVGIPKQYGGQMYEIADGLLQRFAHSDADEVRSHTERIGNNLREQWGDDFDSQVAAVNKLLADAAEEHPVVARLLDEYPHVFADTWIMNSLWNVAQQRNA